jgi:hypothetical protein
VFVHSRLVENPPIDLGMTNPSFLMWFCHINHLISVYSVLSPLRYAHSFSYLVGRINTSHQGFPHKLSLSAPDLLTMPFSPYLLWTPLHLPLPTKVRSLPLNPPNHLSLESSAPTHLALFPTVPAHFHPVTSSLYLYQTLPILTPLICSPAHFAAQPCSHVVSTHTPHTLGLHVTCILILSFAPSDH